MNKHKQATKQMKQHISSQAAPAGPPAAVLGGNSRK